MVPYIIRIYCRSLLAVEHSVQQTLKLMRLVEVVLKIRSGNKWACWLKVGTPDTDRLRFGRTPPCVEGLERISVLGLGIYHDAHGTGARSTGDGILEWQ